MCEFNLCLCLNDGFKTESKTNMNITCLGKYITFLVVNVTFFSDGDDIFCLRDSFFHHMIRMSKTVLLQKMTENVMFVMVSYA